MDLITPIANTMVGILHTLNAITHSYGLSLVLFAVLVKAALYLPTQQQYRAMKDMQRIQPEVEKLREQYKDDPNTLNVELMELYKRHNVSPLGGCGPMLIQMPILLAIWRAIIGQPDLFGSAYFLWIHPGPLQSAYPHYFGSSLADPDLPLLLFYGLTMYLSQLMTPTATEGPHKQIGLFMSFFFTWLVWTYKWPCALVLYWSVFQFLSIIQQGIINREKPVPA